ncbi:MAG TPA: diguanylate cyclase [Candidatus Limnocylindrales bacterium]
MEFRSLLRMILVRWWLVVPTFLITFGSVVVFTLGQTPIYQASSTYLVTPVTAFNADVLTALGLLSRQSEIASTYVEVARSKTIKDQVDAGLALGRDDKKGIDLEARLVTGTNTIEITVRSPTPELAQSYANKAGESLIAYTKDLYDAYELRPLDAAGIPDRPVLPNIPLNLGLGVGAGLALAISLAFAAQLLSAPPKLAAQVNIIDRQSGAYNETYFLLRLRQEMSRSRRSRAPVTMALVNANHHGALTGLSPDVETEAHRRLTALLEGHLRTEDLVAHLGDGVFAFLLPDVPADEAVEVVEGLRVRMAAPALDIDEAGQPVHANGAAGVVTYAGEEIGYEDLLAHARIALTDAEISPSGKVSAVAVETGQAGTTPPTPIRGGLGRAGATSRRGAR